MKIKILLSPKQYDYMSGYDNLNYHLFDGFSISVDIVTLKRTWWGKRKFYRIKLDSPHTQKETVDIFKYFGIISY